MNTPPWPPWAMRPLGVAVAYSPGQRADNAMARVDVKPQLLRWARERSRLPPEALSKRFPKVAEWESGAAKPTLRQLETFANATTTPLGYFFLPEPPDEALPIPDFRTLADRPIGRPSPNLLDTIFDMQRHQAWLREERIEEGASPFPFVRWATPDAAPVKIAAAMRRALGVSAGWADVHGTWSDALGGLRNRIEAVGIIVVVNGVVGNNNFRKLDPEEFRGFVLTDEYAPLIFVNGADGKAAQMFTLVVRLIAREAFFSFYNEYSEYERRRSAAQSGGNFYATQNSRLGRSFAEAVARAVKEGRLLYRDAFDLTGLRGATFDRYIASLGAAAS